MKTQNGTADRSRLDNEASVLQRPNASAGFRRRRAQMLSWLPVPLLVTAMAVLWVANPRIALPNPALFWGLHVGTLVIAFAFVLLPIARGFLANGQPSVLMLGCGVLMSNIGVAAWITTSAQDLNTGFFVYNTSVLLSALCQFVGVAVTSRRRTRLTHSAAWLTAAYAGGTAVMGLVVWCAHAGWMPAFFIEGQGGTPLRSLVVGAAVLFFVLTSALLVRSNRRTPSPFLHWYALGLLLLAAGLGGSMLITVKDSPLQWVTRITQIVGTVYMAVAALVSDRGGNVRGIQLEAVEQEWRENDLLVRLRQQTPLGWALRYGLAVLVVAAGFGLRLLLTAWVGPGLATYITFYPAVMLAALAGGFGPGLAATLFTGFLVAYWILPPVGDPAITSPADRLGMAVFLGMGLFISVVAEFYRRNRDKVAAYDREATLRETQEILRRQAERMDPVRAEVIAREMLHVVRDRGGADAAPSGPGSDTRRRIASAAGVLVAAVGLMVLAGWLFGAEPLKRVLPGLATMKPNTALCFLAAGLALVLRERRAVRTGCAALVCAVTGLTMAEYLTGGSFGIDQLLFRDAVDAHTVFPGRMVEATALGLLFGGASLLLLDAHARVALWAQQALATGAALIGAVAVLGYVNDAQQLYRFAGYSSMALHTAVSLTLLAVGLLFARSSGLGAVLTTPGPGALLTRRMLPGVLLAPVVLGWLVTLGAHQDFYSEDMDLVLLVLMMIVSLTALVFWGAHVLNRSDVTRRDTETQLRNLAELMDHAHEPLIVREPGGAIRSWNRGAEALYGWSAAEALGKRTQELLQTEGISQKELDSQLDRRGRWEGELIHVARDGRLVILESRQTASRTPDGMVFILESNRDITERRQAERELRQSESFKQAVLNSLPAHIAVLNQAGRIVSVNDPWVQFADENSPQGVSRLLTGINYLEVCRRAADADDPLARAAFDGIQSVLECHCGHFEMEYPCHAPTEQRWFLMTVTPTVGTGGAVISHLNITKRKQAEEALRESEARFATTLASIGDAVIATDLDSTITFMNPEAEKLTGWTLHEARRQPVGRIFHIINEHSRQEVESPVAKVLREGTVVGLANHTLLVRKDGTEVPIDDSGAPIRNENGDSTGVVLVFRDITERKQTEAVQAFLAQTGAGTPDEPFFDALARYLAQNLGMDFVCIDRLEGDGLTARTLSVWCDGQFEDNVTYALKDTPCGDVVGKAVCCFPASVCRFFPHDQVLRDLLAESYVGVTLWGRAGQPIGLIAVIGRNPLANRPLAEAMLKLVAVRAGVELERLDAEAVVRENEARFHAAFDEGAVPMVLASLDMKLLKANAAYCRMLGFKESELIGRSFMEFTHPDDRGVNRAGVERLASGETSTFRMEKRYIRKDGAVIWVDLSTASVRDDKDRPIYLVTHVQDITDRRLAEDALRAGEQRERERAEELAVLFEAVPVPVFIARDADCLHLTGNRLADEILRIPHGNELSMSAAEETRPQHFRALKDGRELRLDELPAQRAARGDLVKDFEFTIAFDDGMVRHVLGYGTPLLDDQGNPRGTVSSLVDITDRKRAEDEVQKLASVVRHSREFINIATPEGKMVFLNEAGAEMVGLSAAAVEETHIFQVVPDHLREKVENEVLPALWLDGFWEGELQYLNLLTGALVDVYAATFTVKDPAGNRPLFLVNTSIDITERKRAEDALRRSHDELEQRVQERTQELLSVNETLLDRIDQHTRTLEALRESAARLAEAQRMAHLGNWSWYLDTNTFHWSDETYRLLGFEPQKVVPSYDLFMQRVYPDDRQQVDAEVKEAVAGREAYRSVFRAILPNDEIRHLSAQAEVLLNEKGKPAGLAGTLMDITDQVRAREEARVRHQQLVQADKMVSLGILTSGVAHEINNPNHAIMSNTTLFAEAWNSIHPILEREYQDMGDFVIGGFDYSRAREEYPKMLGDILNASRRIERIVTELRDFARYSPEETLSPIDARPVIESACLLLSSMIKKSTDHFSVSNEENLPKILANRQRIEQVIINLIQNACQSLPGKDRSLTVGTSYSAEKEAVLITISDEGTGISEENLKHLGDPFFTTKRGLGGTGLGLWVSFNIVREHGGILEFFSTPGKGTRAVLTLRASLPL